MSDPRRDRRSLRRMLLTRQIQFRVRQHPVAAVGRVLDLGRGGLFIQTTRAVRPGSLISGALRIAVEQDEGAVRFLGEVVWSTAYDCPKARCIKGPGLGVRFLLLNRNDIARLEALVR